MKREIVLVIHDVRSAHNVGSLLRTADGLGINQVLISGYSPYPAQKKDARLPHISQKISRSIAKTSLSAETSVNWSHAEDPSDSLSRWSASGFVIAALEQTSRAINLNEFKPPSKIVLIVGNEVEGIDQLMLHQAEIHLQIPMLGNKESYNVSVAAAMALFYLRFP
jgi:tRNA G18 (ribose-2'-O)-methylase SpoU